MFTVHLQFRKMFGVKFLVLVSCSKIRFDRNYSILRSKPTRYIVNITRKLLDDQIEIYSLNSEYVAKTSKPMDDYVGNYSMLGSKIIRYIVNM